MVWTESSIMTVDGCGRSFLTFLCGAFGSNCQSKVGHYSMAVRSAIEIHLNLLSRCQYGGILEF